MKDSLSQNSPQSHFSLEKICDLLAQFVAFFTVTAFSVASLLYITNISLRFFSKNSYPWIDQLTGYLFAISPILGASLAIRHDQNLKIEILRKISQTWWAFLIARFFSLIVSIFFLTFFYQHFSIELKRGTVAIVFFKQWMLDLPYLLFFIVSIFFYLETTLKALKQRGQNPQRGQIPQSSQNPE